MSALALRVIACIAMLLDHIGYAWDLMPLRIVGRIAFPIFLYLICNGYKHTSDCRRYALRLGIFALLSQIPFSLFIYHELWSTKGNVFFTLLAALLCIWTADALCRRGLPKWLSPLPAAAVFFLYHYGVLSSDYGAKAIIMAMVFYLFDGEGVLRKLLTVLGVLFALFYGTILSWGLQIIRGGGFQFPVIGEWAAIQIFSLLALPLIILYNGRKGDIPLRWSGRTALQFGFYAFYPLHQLLLCLLREVF